ncbi:MAG: hypothetical protein FWE31_05820 [Firmicutes bacterium]|nr:hypothetical protein [Bacillota bacterium]
MKKLLIATVATIMVVMASVMLVGCGGANIERADLVGRWNLTQTRHNPGGTIRPGDALWLGEYFIEFREDGTFTEVHFWGVMEVSGTWVVEGNTVTLTVVGHTPAMWAGAERTARISGSTLTLEYRNQFLGQNIRYTHTFARA